MAAICSESNRQALESLRTTSQMQPVHAVDAHWPMVDLAVEVTLAQQRRLTLVETYVLRAFSEINGVTVSEIEQNLGLDLQIIKTVMMNLKQCRAIEYGTRAAEVDEDLRRVRQELGTVNNTLLASGLTDEQRKVQVARRDLLKAEEEALVENIEENPRVDWSQRSATLTTDGKQALLEGIIKEPTDLKIYRFARCLVTGVLHRLNSKSLPAHSLRPVHEGAIELDQITNTWALEKKHMEEASISSVGGLPWFPQLQARRAVDPSREEISDLLQEDERVRVDILGHEVVSRSLCDVPTTMCLSVDTSSSFTPMWSLHQERDSTYRFAWMEAHLQQDSKAQLEAMKAIQSTLLPNRRSTLPSLGSMEGVPWVMADSVLSDEASMGNSGFLFDLKKDEIFTMTAMDLPGLDRLEANRLSITINPKLKHYKLEENQEGGIQSLTVAKLHEGKQHPVFGCENWLLKSVRIDVNLNDEVFSLPLLGVDRTAGAEMAQSMDAYLRKSLKSEHMFLLSGAEDDLERWITDLIEDTTIEGLLEVLDVLRLRAHSSSHDYATLLLASIVEHRQDLFSENPVESVSQVLAVFERKKMGVPEKSFRHLEGLLHAQLVRSIHASSSGEDIASLWNDVRAGKKDVAWEDRAHIEFAMDGHCYSTRSMVQTHTEGVIADILEANVGTGRVDLGKMIEALLREGLINGELYERLHARRKERNAVVHVRDRQTSLETTLEHIRDMRAVLGDRPLPSDDDRWKAPSTDQNWQWSMDADKFDEHLKMIQTVIESFPKIDLTSNLWLSYLTQHKPLSHSGVPITPLTRLKSIQESGRLGGIEAFRQDLLESSVKSWRKSLPALNSIMLQSDVLDVLNSLKEMGDEGVHDDVARGILRQIPHPVTLDELMQEIRVGASSCFRQDDLNLRMKQSVEGKSFTVSLSDLKNATEQELLLLPRTVAERMFKASLRPFTVKALGDLGRLVDHVSRWESLAEVSDTHAKVLSGLDPWLIAPLNRDLKSIREALGPEVALARVKAELHFSTTLFPRCEKAVAEFSSRLEERLKNASKSESSSKTKKGDA